jgi:exonuclease 3'-5' domain-containing protein 1
MNEGAIPLAVNEILEFLETEIIPPPADQLIYVDTNELLQDALAIIQENRIMGVDVEGCRLSRTGEACILTIGVAQGVYLFDIVALKELNVNFSHALSFLEDRLVLKIMFDVRGDSDALFHQLNISLVSVLDLQLLDIAAKRTADRRRQPAQYRNSLKTVFTERLEAEELGVYAALTAGLETAHRDFVNNPGLWRERPLRPQLIRYASIGVRWLPILSKRTFLALDDKWQKKVAWTTEQALSEWRDAPVEVDRRNRGNAKAPKFNAQATSIMELDPTLSEQYLN